MRLAGPGPAQSGNLCAAAKKLVRTYTKIHHRAPSESDLERYFQVPPPSIHEMIKTLQRNGLIERTPCPTGAPAATGIRSANKSHQPPSHEHLSYLRHIPNHLLDFNVSNPKTACYLPNG